MKHFHCVSQIATMIIFTLLLVLGKEIAADYTITPIKHNTGLYFEQLQPLRLFKTQWKLVTSLEIRTYLQEEPEIIKHATQAETLCKQRGLSPCPTEPLLPPIMKKLTDSRRYRDMLEGMAEEHKPVYLKKKDRHTRSAPLSFIGTISKVLFGTLTEEDEEHYNNALDTLYTQKNKLAEITANETHIIRSEFNNLHQQLQNLTAQTRAMFQRSETIAESLQETQKAIKRSRLENMLNQWMQVLNIAVDTYIAHLTLMIDAVLFARQGILHPAILSPKQLLTAAETAKNSTSYEFPLTPTELLAQNTNGITNLEISYSKGRILFLLTIPLLDPEIFTLYQIHPNPSTQAHESKTLTIFIKPTPYLAVSDTERKYILPSVPYIQNCFHHHKQYVCQENLPMYKTETRPTCETELLRNPTQETWKKCDIQVSLTMDENWTPLHSKQSWLYYTKTERKIQFFCDGRSIGSDYIHHVGLIHLDPGCTATTNLTQVQAIKTINSRHEQLYAPEVSLDLTLISPGFGEPHIKVLEKLSKLQETGPAKETWLQTDKAIALRTLEEEARKLQSHETLRIQTHAGIISGGGLLAFITIGGAVFILLQQRGAKDTPLGDKMQKPTQPREPTSGMTVTERPTLAVI